jgi:ppGpp synthetase/RelA/SpoT-type nucleotidyltranferase
MSDAILKKYENDHDVYESFSSAVSALVTQLLRLEGIQVHSINHRCKTIASLKGKVAKKRSYQQLEEITDLAGVRLITHYEDDVDRVAKVIEAEFLVDSKNSIDKRVAMDPDKFGYLSLHYVVSLNEERASLRENHSYAGLKAEIQIRSILQHSWAEIEHDTGYKSEAEIPRHIRRRFSRLAGLLEIADREFIDIRNELAAYSKEVTEKIENSVSSASKSDADPLPLDKITIENFVSHDPLITKLDSLLVARLGGRLTDIGTIDSKFIRRLIDLGINSIPELKASLDEYENLVLKRIEQVYTDHGSDTGFEIDKGASLHFFIHVLIAKRIPQEDREDYLIESGYASSPGFLAQLEELAHT